MGGPRYRIVGVLILLGMASCGTDAGVTSRRSETMATTPPSSSAPTTTISTTTTQAPTTTAAPATTTTLPSEGFVPPCVESRRDGQSSVTVDEASLNTFGPLQQQPALVVTLPKGVSEFAPDLVATSAQPTRVPGGVLLTVRSSSDGSFPGTILAVVDQDGVARWVRCWTDTVAQVFAARASGGPSSALVHVSAEARHDYRIISLTDGSTSGTLADHLAAQGVDASNTLEGWPKAWSDDFVLLAPPEGTIIDTSRDHLLRVDLRTLAGELVPFPDMTAGTDIINNDFRLDAAGNPYLAGFQNGNEIVLSSFGGGQWIDGLDAAQIEPTVDFELLPADGDVPALVAVDASGTTLWRRDDITSQPHEGFRTGRSGDVTIVSGCVGTYTDFQCDAPALVGVVAATGDTQWVLDGQRAVVAVGDGYALVTDPITDSGPPAGWQMIDTNSGLAVSGQRWEDPGTFQQECCGGEEFWFVSRDGGVVVAGHETELAIWYPQDSGLSPHSLALP